MAFRSAGSSTSGTGTSAAVPVPSGVAAGDIITVGLYFETTDATVTPPAGFTLKNDTGTTSATTRGRLLTFWKRATAGDTGTYSFTWTTSVVYAAQAIAHSGIVRIGDPFETHAQGVGGSSSGTSASATAITTAHVNTDLVTFATSHATNSVWTPPSGMTEELDTTHLSSAIQDNTAPASSFQKSFTITGTSGNSYPRAWIGALMRDRVAERASTSGTPASTASETVTLPTHEAGDRLVLVVVGKLESANTPTIDQGWTLVRSGTGGTGSPGSNGGPMFIAVYAKDALSASETNPTLTAGASAPNTWVWECHSFKPAEGKVWLDSIGANAGWVQLADDTSTSEGLSVAASAWASPPTAGDAILVVGGVATTAGSGFQSTPTMTVTGLSNGLVLTSQYAESSIGNNSAILGARWVGFGGTASAGLSTTLDVFGASTESGPSAAVALRQGVAATNLSVAATIPQPTMAVSLTGFNDSDLSVAATIPKPTMAVSLTGFNDSDLSAAGTIPQPVMAVSLSVTPTTNQLTVAGTIPKPTLAVSLSGFNDSDLTVAGTIPQPVLAVTLAIAEELAYAGTVAQPVMDVQLEAEVVGASLSYAGSVPMVEMAVDLLVQTEIVTQTWNRAGGRVRHATAELAWSPPVVLPEADELGVDIPFARIYNNLTFDTDGNHHYDAGPETYAYGTMLIPRMIVEGVDVTVVDGVRTPVPDYEFNSPLGYGPSVWTFETIGPLRPLPAKLDDPTYTGDLPWCAPDAHAVIEWIDVATGEVVPELTYHAIFDDFPSRNGNTLEILASGWWAGHAAMRYVEPQLFGTRQDIGRQIARLTEGVPGVHLEPRLGPTTGIKIQRVAGVYAIEVLNQLVQMLQTTTSGPYDLLPTVWGGRTFQLTPVDTETIHATFYGEGAALRLQRERVRELERVFGTGVTPWGRRVRNGRYPAVLDNPDEVQVAAPYPFSDERAFGLGTTDADTDTGDGIRIMQIRLQTYGFLSKDDVVEDGGDTFGPNTEKAVNRLRRRASSGRAAENGLMTPNFWDALYNINRVGTSLLWSKIEPMAQVPESIKWDFSADGSILGKNPDYRGYSQRFNDKFNNYGAGLSRAQMFDFSDKELADGTGPVIFGELDLGDTGGLLEGSVDPGTELTDDMFKHGLTIRPGMNIRLPLTNWGDIVVHVATVPVRGGRPVAQVANRLLDSVPLYEILEGVKQKQGSTGKAWFEQNRASAKRVDTVIEFDEMGGQINPIAIPGGQWKVFKVVAGQLGMIEQIYAQTSPATRFVMAFFGLPITEAKLESVEPNPLAAKSGFKANMQNLDRKHRLLYLVGEPGDLAGYGYGSQSDGDALTGELIDQETWPYRTGRDDGRAAGWIYGAYFGEDDAVLEGDNTGRLLWNQELVGQ